MCGIVGIFNAPPVAEKLLGALKRIEYRGYDSAGLATFGAGGLRRRRAVGKLDALRRLLEADPIDGAHGLGHTRWATHGRVTEANAHPHLDDERKIAVVHNGIIENHAALRAELQAEGMRFVGESDSEILPHLLARACRGGSDFRSAFFATLDRLEGSYALAVLFRPADPDAPPTLMGAHRGAPLALGESDGASSYVLGSDSSALFSLADRVRHLSPGDAAVIDADGPRLHDRGGRTLERRSQPIALAAPNLDKGSFDRFMLKEIHEQPEVMHRILNHYRIGDPDGVSGDNHPFENLPFDATKIDHLSLSACGTGFFAAAIARRQIEACAHLRVSAEIASEFRSRPTSIAAGPAVFISQSGETADTVAAMRRHRESGAPAIALVNNEASTLAREADFVLSTFAGPEISVASTKAFTAQTMIMTAFALHLGRRRRGLDVAAAHDRLIAVAESMAAVIAAGDRFIPWARRLTQARSVFYIGRGTMHPLACEGALKLAEVSYIPASGFPGGELKHGPIALIDERTPTVALVPENETFAKTMANIEEIRARGGEVLAIADERAGRRMPDDLRRLHYPASCDLSAPLAAAPALQLLAYHAATMLGTDVDRPRNLAKSVTVE